MTINSTKGYGNDARRLSGGHVDGIEEFVRLGKFKSDDKQ